jgi:RNA polymerase sigma-70 factor (ECF subfamily)
MHYAAGGRSDGWQSISVRCGLVGALVWWRGTGAPGARWTIRRRVEPRSRVGSNGRGHRIGAGAGIDVNVTDDSKGIDAMRRLQAGDREAVGALYDLHASLLYGVILRIVRDRMEADDVMQEAWVHAWQRAGSFDPARGSVPAWLVTIARSRALDRLRRRATRARAEEQAPSPSAPETPLGDAERLAVGAGLARAMSSLDPRHREVLEVAYFEGLSQSEIAARMGTPLGTVKHWTRQGLLRLRELLPRDDHS